ncbi:Carbamoyl-phosphate synthase large chain [Bienertia sinuspersici]
MGRYYLQNDRVEHMLQEIKHHALRSVKQIPTGGGRTALNVEMSLEIPGTIEGIQKMSTGTLWHFRLGHIPRDRMEKVQNLRGYKSESQDVCMICPLAKMTKNTLSSEAIKSQRNI